MVWIAGASPCNVRLPNAPPAAQGRRAPTTVRLPTAAAPHIADGQAINVSKASHRRPSWPSDCWLWTATRRHSVSLPSAHSGTHIVCAPPTLRIEQEQAPEAGKQRGRHIAHQQFRQWCGRAELSPVGELCSFDAVPAGRPASQQLVANVRGACTLRLDLKPQSPGLYALSLGLSAVIRSELSEVSVRCQ